MVRYWWSSSIDHRSMHWISWEALLTPKSKDDMGFRNIEMFTLALVSKHAVAFYHSPDSLFARVLKTNSSNTNYSMLLFPADRRPHRGVL
jgi:hypothetical protein